MVARGRGRYGRSEPAIGPGLVPERDSLAGDVAHVYQSRNGGFAGSDYRHGPHDFEKNLNEAVRQLSHLCGRHKKVYVHCNVGINRSPTAILAYLIFTGMEFEEAQRALRARRECIPYVDVVKRWSEGKRAG